MRNLRRFFLLALGLCLFPLAAVLFSTLLAGVLGCELNEGGPQPCTVLGLDIGGLLSPMFVMGWFALFTLPLMAIVLGVWALFEGGVAWRKRRRARKAERLGADQPGMEA